MASTPVRYPSGIATNLPKTTLAFFPQLPATNQLSLLNEFIPFRSTDFTLTQLNGTFTPFVWNSGGAQLNTVGTTAGDKALVTTTSFGKQLITGNQAWYSCELALPAANIDVNLYAGWFNTADPSVATDGVYFFKPAGGTLVNLIVKKASVTTTFQNVADLAKPSGQTSNPLDVVGTLGATQSGGLYNSISVTAPGFGYNIAPLVQATGATGTLAAGYVQLGSSSLYAPLLTNPGSAYTTASFVITPIISLQMYLDVKGNLMVGVGGKTIMSISKDGAVGFLAGATVNLLTTAGRTFTSQTLLTTAVAPILPFPGAATNITPTVNLASGFGFTNTTAAARQLIVKSLYLGGEYN